MFYVVYITEAHPTDLWQVQANVRGGVLFAAARTEEERTSTALACVRKLDIRLPALLDGIDNPTEEAYTGWPDRLYVLDHDGHIAYKSAPGPFGFKPAEVEATLQQLFR